MCLKNLSILTTIVLLFAWETACSQTPTTSYTPKIIPPSPNAATIAKFGDIPVSLYTGTTDISIPIYTVSTKDISVPVGLNYHTGGIRLSEESGIVGLGWALNAGGIISRTVNDKDDFDGNYFNTNLGPKSVPEVKGKMVYHNVSSALEQFGNGLPNPMTYTPVGMGLYGYDFGCRYTVYSSENNYNFFPVFNNGIVSQDMEPDQYTFNFPGGSGKFIIARDGKVVLQKQENLKVEYAPDGAWFAITDDHGNKFYFYDIELSQPSTGIGGFTNSSWLLSKIVTQQKDSVMFNYSSDNTWTTVKGICHETFRTGCSGFDGSIYTNDVAQTYLNKTLDNIDWTNGQIKFEYDAIRTDLQNGKKLNTVKVYAKDQSGSLLYQKEHRLYYSYFNNTASDELEFKRLRLDSVKELSGTSVLPPYVFTYNMPATLQNLLGKHYSSIDHWGYFNGKSNAVNGDFAKGFTAPFTGIINIGDNYSGNINTAQFINLTGADREADSTFMKAFVLKQVNYPTGGFTVFEYDPNYYDYDSSKGLSGSKDFEYVKTISKVVQVNINKNGTFSGTIDFSDIYLTSNLVSNANLTVSFRAAKSDSLNYYHNNLGYGKINFVFQNNTTDISNSGLQCSGTMNGTNCSGTVYSMAIPLTIASATTYSWTGYIDPKIKISSGFIDISATFTYLIPEYKTKTIMMAGGLRIKSIADYAASGTLAKKRNYDYGYQQDRNADGMSENYSYGRLMGYISYARYEPVIITISNPPQPSTQFICRNLSRYSGNFSGFTSMSSGNIVGYDQVSEYTVDLSNNDDNGKTVYTFYNCSDTSFSYGGFRLPGVSNLPNNLNGLSKSKTIFKKIGKVYNKVSESNYYYHSTNRILYNAPKYNFYWDIINAVRSNSGCPLGIDSLTTPLITCFYPAISSEKILFDSTVEKFFDQNDINKIIVTKSYNFYDNPKHFQLTRNQTTDSKLNTHVAFMKYPQDYITSGNITGNTILDSLIGKNMLGTVIEKRDSLYYTGSSIGYVIGAQLSKYRFLNQNVLGLDKQYQLAVASPITNFQSYTISGNSTTQDNRYRQMISFDTYDNNYNILQFTQSNHAPSAFVYDYNNQYPVAQVIKATSDQVASTSFESDGKGNWNNFSGLITNITSTPYPPTGNKYYNLTTSAPLSKVVTIGKSYTISYWSKNGIYNITGGGSTINTTGITVGAWTYYEQKTTASLNTLAITGTGAIDEVRLYPSDAQMTTYTYDAFGGITSQCDINNRISYYEYDGLHRLSLIRDQNKNIIKQFCYNYAGQPTNCDGNIFYNVAKSQVFTKKDCSPTYYNGSSITYIVNANKYYSFISQADADQKALDDIAANGQNYANANGTCAIPSMINLKYTNSTPTSMIAVFKHKLSGTTYTFTLAANVTTQTIIGQIMQGGPYDVTITPSSGSNLYSYQVNSYTQSNIYSFYYADMSIICSTCAIISVSNQH